ncbi:DUF3971 domain-containing protein [Acetobacteraceae bacterium H6797]|nr:DUF3971 domain-containing protein [Acetobacteraceae bacterium H6797]
MSTRTGQALRSGTVATLRGCGLLMRFLFALVLLAALGIGALSWRLDQGPIWLPMLARGIEQAGDGQVGGMHLRVDRAGIAWTGWREGHLSPVEFRVVGARLLDEAGHVRAELPDGAVALSLPWLLRGKVAPRRIEMASPKLTLVRQMDGGVSLDFGLSTPESLSDTQPAEEDQQGEGAGDALLGMLSGEGGGPLSALQEIILVDGEVTVIDRQGGGVWRFAGVEASLRRRAVPGRAMPGISGSGKAQLLLGVERVPITLSGESEAASASVPAGVKVSATLTGLKPDRLASFSPVLKPLAGIDAPMTLGVSGRFGLDGALREARAQLDIGAGRLTISPTSALMLDSARLAVAVTPDTAILEPSEIRLAPASAQPAAVDLTIPAGQSPAPVIRLRGQAALDQTHWKGRLEVSLDRVAMAELPAFWPQGLSHNTRDWLAENVTAGTARNGVLRVGAETEADFSGFKLTALEGSMSVDDATVHWLRPVPPLSGVSGTVNFSPTEVNIRAQGTQSGTALQVQEANLRFYALDTNDEQLQIEGKFSGPVADMLTVLKHPRLKLFDKRPLEIKSPAGTAEVQLSLGLPLLADLPAERITVNTTARISNMRVADAVLGQPIERGQFTLNVTNRGLKASGTATVGGVPGKLGMEMDFRDGPATQVITRESAEIRGDAQALSRFGLDFSDLVNGPVGVVVNTERRRNGRGDVAVKADLRDAAVDIDALGWSKPRGAAATGEATLRLQGERLLSADSIRLTGPRLAVSGQAFFGDGNRFERVELGDARIDESRFSGTVSRPLREGSPWRFSLRGSSLDLSGILADKPGAPPASSSDSTPVSIDARFDRVLLGPGRVLGNVSGTAQSDARGVLREARISGRTDSAEGAFDLIVTPRSGGRDLKITAQDGGALLKAFDVLKTVSGGKLVATGRWQSNAPGSALVGQAEMDGFTITNAAAIGKFLQAITLYGLVDAARGPGLSFNRAIIPFALTPEVLQLNEARAFSASLGVTAKGQIRRHDGRIDLDGTVVPAYAFNTLLGNIPILGRLFSPERGGGLIAVNWGMHGSADDPSVTVNPLSVLTPGFLRGLFGIFDNASPGNSSVTPPGQAGQEPARQN